MFAEELGGNASRKRQEENRARRRKLKQEQLKKAQQEKQKEQQQQQQQSTSQTSPASASASTVTSKTPETSVGAIVTTKTVPESSLSVVQIANIQRQQRQEIQAQKIASVKIQSFYRAHRSNSLALQEQNDLLSKRLQDLATLRLLLKKQDGTEYVPPPATATALCRQLLFLTSSIGYKQKCSDGNVDARSFVKLRNTTRDSKLIQQLFDLVLTPE